MSDRPAPTGDEIRTWLFAMETPVGDLCRGLDCLIAITDSRRVPRIDPEALAWLVYQVQDNALEIHAQWAEMWKLVVGHDPDPDKPAEFKDR